MIDWSKVKPPEGPDLGAIKPKCKYHDFDAVCDKCPERYDTDGVGFPHPKAVPADKRRLKHCKGCDTVVDREHWNNLDWKCTKCKPVADESRRDRVAQNVRASYPSTKRDESYEHADQVMQPGLLSLTEKRYENGAKLPAWTPRTNEQEQQKRRDAMKQRRDKLSRQ